MNFWRRSLIASLLVSTSVLLGCNEKSEAMRNMQPGTGPPVHKDLIRKKGNKPMPADPPDPKAPP
jgi:hypothetical protein